MRRLIDANAMIEDAFTIPDETSNIIKDACDAQPTIDAIPLEWLERQRTMCYPGSERELFLRRLIADWKREQNR